MSEEELLKCIDKQNMEDSSFSEKEVREGMKLKFITGKRDSDVCNWMVEYTS